METFCSVRSRDYNRGLETQSWNSYFGVGEQSTGYYIETDISFSDKVKKNLKDFPPTPTHITVDFDDLSEFAQQSFIDCHGSKKMYRNESKLMYVHGVEFLNIRSVLAFTQSDFLKSWVDLNTRGRKRAALAGNELLRGFFKVSTLK